MAFSPPPPAEAPSYPSLADRPRQARVPRISPVRTDEHPDPSRAPLVLIAEDHEDSRDALRTLLDAFGYRVVEACNGRQAVELARAERPDLILMDMMMPQVDGFQATREIRSIESLHGVPIVALTAMEGARDRVMQAGCDDMVPKPLDVRAFLDRVRVWTTPGRAT
ncbi:MAG: response regulator [Gemmatimonadetes bacterium]|nr:response regulator [Gemmatimonadota bacterium]